MFTGPYPTREVFKLAVSSTDLILTMFFAGNAPTRVAYTVFVVGFLVYLYSVMCTGIEDTRETSYQAVPVGRTCSLMCKQLSFHIIVISYYHSIHDFRL